MGERRSGRGERESNVRRVHIGPGGNGPAQRRGLGAQPSFAFR